MGGGRESFWKGAFELDFEGMNMSSLEVCDVPFIQQTFTYTLSLGLGSFWGPGRTSPSPAP